MSETVPCQNVLHPRVMVDQIHFGRHKCQGVPTYCTQTTSENDGAYRKEVHGPHDLDYTKKRATELEQRAGETHQRPMPRRITVFSSRIRSIGYRGGRSAN